MKTEIMENCRNCMNCKNSKTVRLTKAMKPGVVRFETVCDKKFDTGLFEPICELWESE